MLKDALFPVEKSVGTSLVRVDRGRNTSDAVEPIVRGSACGPVQWLQGACDCAAALAVVPLNHGVIASPIENE